ncbi:HlyD family secretion protein [Virgibacillus halophilus]|uniref:HlyD family efflux transporter periplasmic adaptor subunit n=1 Tax=Tigheibacillus halophilus TaxID=361280 RepID=A0ABU5C3P0_9BACI|nr:HlyD family efflux transporter periplasmic adaptor subunit [Virgibacillus halophilus]
MSAKKMIMINIIVLIILIGGGIAGYYFYYQAANYVKTDDAKIEGKMITIGSPADGKLSDWDAVVGKKYEKGEKIGEIEAASGNGVAKKAITIPQDATIVKEDGVKNAMIGAGTKLAQAFDLKDLWITANIDESDIDHVKTGKSVDIVVDAYNDTTLTGKVEQIGLATKDTFSLLPSSGDNDDNVIPVKISIDDYKGLRLVPGINAHVKIDR